MTELYDTGREPVGDDRSSFSVVIHNGQVIPGSGVLHSAAFVNHSKAA